jgi:hypothetical protein
MRLHDEHPHRPVTLVWLDADEAILLTGEGSTDSGVDPPVVRRLVSGVPPHRRATGQAHHDSRVRSGGGADPDDLANRRREHLLAAYLREVAALVPEADQVLVIGPGQVHGRLAHELRAGQSSDSACADKLVAECREGLGGPEYVELMRTEASPRALLARFDRDELDTLHDQWQVQVQAMVQARCDVWLHSALDRASVESAHLSYAADVDGALEHIIGEQRARLGREPSVCVMPYGQLTVPRLVE